MTPEIKDESPIIPPNPHVTLIPFSVRIPKDWLEEIAAIAEVNGYSRNEVILRLVGYALEAHRLAAK